MPGRGVHSVLMLSVLSVPALAAPSRSGWYPGQDFAECFSVRVVDVRRQPVVGAEVTLWNGLGGTQWVTDSAGSICSEEVLYGGKLEVVAPPLTGGACAGTTGRIELYGWSPELGAPFREIVLPIHGVPRARWHGRVLDDLGRPISGVEVFVDKVDWGAGDENCTVTPDVAVRTDATGTFVLPLMPRGMATVRLVHPGHATRRAVLSVPGSPQALVMRNGASWSGRVLGPDRRPLEHCRLRIENSQGDLHGRECSSRVVTVEHLPSGTLKVDIHLERDPIWGTRHLRRTLQISANATLLQDLQIPAGLELSGQLVTETGEPLSKTALSLVHAEAKEEGYPIEVLGATDEQGGFVFHHLTDGDWLLAWGGYPQRIRIRAGAPPLVHRAVK